MKLTKKILVLSSALLLGASATFGITKFFSVAKAEESEFKVPHSLIAPLYRYANALGDEPADVDNALKEWLNATDNLGGLAFFDSDPEEYNEQTFRKTKDAFYVIAYLQEYISRGTIDSRAPMDALRTTLDRVMAVKDDFIGFLTHTISNYFSGSYSECKILYEFMLDIISIIEGDIYSVYYQPVETFVSQAKKYLQKQIDHLLISGFDESLNNYSVLKSMVNGFGNLASQNTMLTDEYSTEIIDYVLFNQDSHIDSYFPTDLVDFTYDEYCEAAYDASIFSSEEYEEFSAPYIEKLDLQMFVDLLTYNFVTSYFDQEDPIKCFNNNCGPLMYKMLDYAEAKTWNDAPNIVAIGFGILEDFEILLGELDLKENQMDLEYEKFLANARLGSLVYNEKSPAKFNKFLANIDLINNVSLDDQTYEEAVTEINNLVTAGYKNLNTNIVSNSDYATLSSVEGLEELADREQAYSFELRKMRSSAPVSLINTQVQEDYEDNSIYTNAVLLDLVLTNQNCKEEVTSIDNPVSVSFEIEGLQNCSDINVYRYDSANEKLVVLDKEETDTKTDYFVLSSNNLTVHTKNFGSFAIVYIKTSVKQDIEQLRSNFADLQDDYDELSSSAESLSSQINELTSEVNGLTIQINTLTADIEDLDAEILDLNAQITTLTAQVGVRDASIAELEDEIEELEANIEELQSVAQSKQSELDSIQTELNAVKANLNTKIDEVSSLEATVESKNTVNTIFIVLTCVFAVSTAGLLVLYLLKNKKDEQE